MRDRVDKLAGAGTSSTRLVQRIDSADGCGQIGEPHDSRAELKCGWNLERGEKGESDHRPKANTFSYANYRPFPLKERHKNNTTFTLNTLQFNYFSSKHTNHLSRTAKLAARSKGIFPVFFDSRLGCQCFRPEDNEHTKWDHYLFEPNLWSKRSMFSSCLYWLGSFDHFVGLDLDL